MKKKSKLLFTALTISTTIAAISSVIFSNAEFNNVIGATEYWPISFSQDKLLETTHDTHGAKVEEYYEDGTATVKTDQNKNDVNLAFSNVYRYDNSDIKWLEVKRNSEGYLYNTSSINSMYEIRIYFYGTIKVEWGWDKIDGIITYEKSQSIKHTAAKYETFDFGNDAPNYFRIVNSSNSQSKISDIRITLSKSCTPGSNPNKA